MAFVDANGWTDDDYRALAREASRGHFRPEDWLCVSSNESGLVVRREAVGADGKIVRGSGTFAQFTNKDGSAGARGLTQMMPATLKGLGFVPGDADFDSSRGDYRELSVQQQIVWSGKYFKATGVRSWNSAGDLYLANFMPGRLAHKDDPDFKLAVAPSRNYTDNIGFDRKDAEGKRKGYITVGDVGYAAAASFSSSPYKQAALSLNSVRQMRLNECLPTREPLATDGLIGPKTLSRVKEFRYAAGLPLNGGLDAVVDTALFAP